MRSAPARLTTTPATTNVALMKRLLLLLALIGLATLAARQLKPA